MRVKRLREKIKGREKNGGTIEISEGYGGTILREERRKGREGKRGRGEALERRKENR